MGYQLELRHFKYFMAVAEELHFRKAAERLHISQPGLSRQIRQMEEILDAELFVRDKRNVVLTPAGAYLKDEIAFILNHLEFTKRHVSMIDKGSEGELRIGFLGSAMQNVIPELLLRMNKEFPKLKSSLEEMSNHDQVKAIQEDELDIGFVRLARVPDGLYRQPVFTDTFSLVVPKSLNLDVSNFKGIEQVAQENFILFSADYSSDYYNKIMSICDDAGFVPKVSHKSVHAQTIFKLVESGLGIAIVPTSLQHGYDLAIRFIELKNIPQEAVLSVIWKKDNRNPALQRVQQFFKE